MKEQKRKEKEEEEEKEKVDWGWVAETRQGGGEEKRRKRRRKEIRFFSACRFFLVGSVFGFAGTSAGLNQ